MQLCVGPSIPRSRRRLAVTVTITFALVIGLGALYLSNLIYVVELQSAKRPDNTELARKAEEEARLLAAEVEWRQAVAAARAEEAAARQRGTALLEQGKWAEAVQARGYGRERLGLGAGA